MTELIGDKRVSHQLVLALSTVTMVFFCGLAKAKSSFKSKEAARIQSLEAKLKKNKTDLRTREKLGRIYAKHRQFNKVIELLGPYSSEIGSRALMQLAVAYRSKKDHENEIRILKIVRDKIPKDHLVPYYLGKAYFALNQTVQAIKELRLSIKLDEEHLDSYESLLEVFESTKNNYEARLIVNDMIRIFGERPPFSSKLCQLQTEAGLLNEALKNCRAAIMKDPQHAENHVYLAQAYIFKKTQKSEKMAQSILLRAAKRFPQSEYVQFATARHFEKKGNLPVAARFYTQAVKAGGKRAESHLGLAKTNFKIGKYEPALQAFITACKVDRSKTVQPFMAAAAKLRQQGKRKLSRRFEGKAYNCRQSSN